MMKRYIPLILAISCTNAYGSTKMKTTEEKVSYSIGVNIGKDFKTQEITINPDKLSQGIKDAYLGKKIKIEEAERQKLVSKLHKQVVEKQQEKMRKLAESNLKSSNEFLEKNKKNKNILTLDSGLQYEVLTKGKGASPKETDEVTVHYKGTLIDGTEFDNSYTRGEPAVFPVNGVIPGWIEALQLMKPGDKWKVFIPPSLAYGERGQGPIGPNSALIFEVELISVNTESDDSEAS